ncbi:nitrate reductase molybdenum cofactor assembly chaperone [Moraxella caviae]|uniref:Nitrate reductase molybdenum cofactor assembly chaperone n=1 Tax=Moraxella caviae TaxID=34060 RepID=A0A1T0A5U7_9GAMM|nr:nitrate reductase molybdenum cofactor assembly chaperone [Moraxella caviae]OOR91094.1 nitrate reductase molybdenum cofactor assembly chaperone [Moraxella caviae]STZ14208.1 Redox enzyme maturation protein NarJ [Moraxella caviae]VEW13448.1 Redox enzyme maturation protein NarJ [Moraxella caviae]
MTTVTGADFKLLKVVSLLMDYPDDALFADDTLTACKEVVKNSVLISPQIRAQIADFIDNLSNMGAIDAQTRYDGLFERGRTLSLWLFEHVHGESRDRGQAMVDLMAQYEEAGFAINVKELPDYLPMYLEFLAYQATQTDDTMSIRMDLADVSHIVALLGARLVDKDSDYACLFKALLQVAGQSLSVIDDELAKMGKNPVVDDTTFEAIDKEWEEEVVDFMSAKQEERCPSNQTNQHIAETLARQAQNDAAAPVHWVDFKAKRASTEGALL